MRELPRGPLVLPEGFSICHGSPLDEDTYVFSMYEAWEIFESYRRRTSSSSATPTSRRSSSTRGATFASRCCAARRGSITHRARAAAT